MAQNSFSYFFNIYNSSATGRFKIHYDFNTTGSYVINTTGNTGSFTGVIVPQVNNFWNTSGSGFFSGNYIKIQDTGNAINFCNSTYSIIYDKRSVDGGTLISTVCTGYDPISGVYYQGFEFGVTANNYLYFEYYTDSGPQTFLSNIPLADKASVFLNIKTNNLSFGNYDYFYQNLNSVAYDINSNYLFDTTNLYIGFNPNTGLYSYNKQFSGYMDEFSVFYPPIEQNDLVALNSGYSNSYFTGTSYVTYISGTGIITGYNQQFTGYYAQVTGYQTVVTGTITDDFGNVYDGLDVVPVTGYLSGYTYVPLYGTGIYATTGVSGQYSTLDSGYVYSFGKKNINILSKINTGDIVDILIPDNKYPYNIENNLMLSYDNINNNFYNLNLNNNSKFIVFVNGLAQSSGTSNVTGTIYSNANIYSRDYSIDSNNKVSFANMFDMNDTIFVDMYTGYYDTGIYFKNFSLQNYNIIPVKLNQYNLFFNGQKLISGIHYINTGNTGAYFNNVIQPISGSGNLFALPKNFNIEITGTSNNYNNLPVFYTDYTEVYKNGVRLELEQDYLELAIYDINTGSGIFDTNSNLLYNNNDVF
jgi:hypothetical protein